MAPKKKLNPVITRIKLNPEQAVLACACYSGGKQSGSGAKSTVCVITPSKSTSSNTKSAAGAVSS